MRQLNDLEYLLQRMNEQYTQLAVEVQSQQAAMKTGDIETMSLSVRRQEAFRLRIAGMESRRIQLVRELGILHKVEGEITIGMLAELHPERGEKLIQLRDELKETARRLHVEMTISARVAGAVLGHLNTAVRILATAAQGAGIYTKYGVPYVAERLGIVEAIA